MQITNLQPLPKMNDHDDAVALALKTGDDFLRPNPKSKIQNQKSAPVLNHAVFNPF
jgi:hypothetical protein